MTRTLTTEQLREIMCVYGNTHPCYLAAAECLANREAQPVAWEMRYWNSGHNMWHDWERITAEQHAEMSVKFATDNDYEFRVLYDAPLAPKSNAADWGINMQTGTPILVYKNCSVIESEQAHYVLPLINSAVHPAPAVPVLITEDEQEEDVSQGYANSFRGGWNACRAAMLAQPVSSGCKFPEEWIACSDRMPDETQPVIVVSDGGVVQRTVYQFCDGVWSDWYDEHDHLNADTFTHWMPLPAAPEGGNG